MLVNTVNMSVGSMYQRPTRNGLCSGLYLTVQYVGTYLMRIVPLRIENTSKITIYALVKYTGSLLSELGICCMCFLRMYDR
jgi:hypothetical protein